MDSLDDEPPGLPPYMQERMKLQRTISVRRVLVVISLIIASSALWGIFRLVDIADVIRMEDDTAERIAQQRARFNAAFEGLGINSTTLASGFWYTYVDAEGNEHVLYFDMEALARADLSDAELRQLIEVVSKSRISDARAMRPVPLEELPSDLQFHNAVYSFGASGATTLDMKQALVGKVESGTASSEELFQLSYLYELEGNYAERDRLNRENCARFGARCTTGEVIVSGRVVDNRGMPIAGVNVNVVSHPDIPSVATDANGLFSISTGALKMEKMRFRATKRNFSDGYADVILVADGVKNVSIDDIVLESPLTVVTVDFGKGTVTGEGNHITTDGVVVTTPNSIYKIPRGAVINADGTPHQGPIDIYLYEFTKGNPPESLMQVDTFDQVMGYAGDLMKTFGMPYIQFFAQDGAELHVLKSKPMVLTYRIADMDALRTNQDQIYGPLTDKDMELLVEASRGAQYPIDRAFLINNQLLRFPAFWVFDRKRGIWDNVGVSVLDTQGTIQTIFYTIRDDV